jgi:hypothetical protein
MHVDAIVKRMRGRNDGGTPVDSEGRLGTGSEVAVTTISIQTGGSGMPKLEAERLSFFWTGLDALLVKKSSCSRSF